MKLCSLVNSKTDNNVLSPNSYTHISVRDLYIFPGSICLFFCSQICGHRSWEYINRSQTHECRERGRAVSFLEIHKVLGNSFFRYTVHKLDFRYSARCISCPLKHPPARKHINAYSVSKYLSPLY